MSAETTRDQEPQPRGKRERIMEILVFLLGELRAKKQIMEIDLGPLTNRGFSDTEISAAFTWLFERLGDTGEEDASGTGLYGSLASTIRASDQARPSALGSDRDASGLTLPQTPSEGASIRILHEHERAAISSEAQGYLLQARELGLIDATEYELIIDRIMMAGFLKVSLEDMKEMIAATAFDLEDAYRAHSRLMLALSDRIQ